jgi:precorrin isomerase
MKLNAVIQTVVAADPHGVYENALREKVITAATNPDAASLTLALTQYAENAGNDPVEHARRAYLLANILSEGINIPDSPEGDHLINLIDEDGIHAIVINAGITERLDEFDQMEANLKTTAPKEDKKDEVIDTPKEYVVAYLPSFLLICGVLVVGFLIGGWHQRRKDAA